MRRIPIICKITEDMFRRHQPRRVPGIVWHTKYHARSYDNEKIPFDRLLAWLLDLGSKGSTESNSGISPTINPAFLHSFLGWSNL
jgi:hypothetical protein